MANKIVRYVGVNHFDVILYTTRIMTKLSKRVLIIDYSQDKAIRSTLPLIKKIDCMDSILNYRDINYICDMPIEDISKFDVIFIIYGFHTSAFARCENDQCFIVSSQMSHDNIRTCECIKNKDVSNAFLVVRDVHDINRIEDTINALGLNHTYDNNKISTILYDHRDVYQAFYCESRKCARFSEISYELKKHLIDHVHSILPDISIKDIKKAYESAKKGFSKT